MKHIGWIGIVDGKPFFETTTDDYVELGENGIPVVDVYKTRKEARKRFEQVTEVFIKDGKS